MPIKTTKRLFISFNFPENTKKEINNLILNIKTRNPSLKWISEENLHLTLYFLGEVNEREENIIKLILQNFERKFSAIDFIMENIGVFPTQQKPKIIYLDCRQTNGNYIVKMWEMLGAMMEKHLIKFDKKSWKPHITLARVNTGQKFILKNEEFEPIKTHVDGIYLMESTLTRNGSVYKVIEKFKLS